MTIAKPKGGFRVVHQLEPIDSVLYTALACEIALQTVKLPVCPVPNTLHARIAYPYLMVVILPGVWMGDFGQKTESLADTYENVLCYRYHRFL